MYSLQSGVLVIYAVVGCARVHRASERLSAPELLVACVLCSPTEVFVWFGQDGKH